MRGASFLKRNLLKVPFNIPIRETAARNPFIYAGLAGGWENARNLLGKRKEPFGKTQGTFWENARNLFFTKFTKATAGKLTPWAFIV